MDSGVETQAAGVETRAVGTETRTDAMRVLGLALRELREQRGFQKADVLRRVDVHLDGHSITGLIAWAYTHWEAGRRSPSPRQMVALLFALDVPSREAIPILSLAVRCDAAFLGGQLRLEPTLSSEEQYTAWAEWARIQPQRAPRAVLWR